MVQIGDIKHENVRHIVRGGLKHGRYYRCYVTQVNSSGLESYRSDPSLIRVGDIQAPPAPSISLDTSVYPSGCHCVGESCDVYFKWSTPECDDLDCYNVLVWKNKPDWCSGGGSYDKEKSASADMSFLISGKDNSTSIGGQKAGNVIYIGIQAIDKSRNRSAINIIRVVVVDNSFLAKPTEPITASVYGIWSIRVQTRCPYYDNIRAIEIFRDGEDSIAKLLFVQGMFVEFVDILEVEVGLTHYYTYRYITTDGRVSPMSDPSESVTAEVIDLRYINKAKLEAFNDAWSGEGIKDIESLREQAEAEAAKTQALAKKLEQATKDYEETFNSYKRLVNNFEQLSAKVINDEKTISTLRTSIEQTAKAVTLKANKTDLDNATQKINNIIENKLEVNQENIQSIATQIQVLEKQAEDDKKEATTVKTALQTQIKQNADAIKLRATKSDIDSKTNQVTQQLVSQINVQKDRITTVVSSVDGNTSQITQLNNAIQLCATKDGISAAVALAVQNGISVATLTANRIVVTGEMLFQGNARLVGRLSANYLAVVDQNGKVIWGSDTGVLKPQIVEGDFSGHSYSCAGGHNQWLEIQRVPLTPQPPVNFNGQSLVKLTCNFILEVEMATDSPPNNASHRYLGDLKIDNVNATLNGTSVGSPLCKLNGFGANVVSTQGNRIDYFPITGGWRSVGGRRYQTTAAFTITYNGSATIGRQAWFAIYGRIFDAQVGVCINRITIFHPKWRAECS